MDPWFPRRPPASAMFLAQTTQSNMPSPIGDFDWSITARTPSARPELARWWHRVRLLSSSRRGAAACYPPSVAARDQTRAHRCIGSADAFSVLTRRGCCLHPSPRQMSHQPATTPDVDKIPRSHFPLPHAALLPLLGTSFTRLLPPPCDSSFYGRAERCRVARGQRVPL